MDTNRQMKAENKEDRKCFLDVLRLAATCAVVLLHTVTGVSDTHDMGGYPVEKTVFLILMDLITWCVPVFIMISGYLFLDAAKSLTWKEMLGKYCRRIVLALFCFGIPYALLELMMEQKGFHVDMLGRSIWMVCTGRSWSHMWYLYLIILLYLLTPLLRMVLHRMPVWAVYLILAALAAGSSLLPFIKKAFGLETLPVLPDGGIYFFYYICGYLLGERKAVLRREQTGLIRGIVLVLVAGMVFSRLAGGYHVQMAYNYPFTVALSLLLVILAQDREDIWRRKNTVPFRKAGELCFAVYLVHPLFLNILYKLFHVTPLHFFIGFSLPLIFGAVLLASFAAAYLLHKIPPLHRYVL